MLAPPRLLVVAGITLALVIVAALLLPRPTAVHRRHSGPTRSAAHLPHLDEAAGWLNGGPLTADSLRGRPVVLVLWSDTDARCLDVLPEVETWHRAYGRYGVRVIGVHAPDYTFAGNAAIPARVVRRLGLSFPIALDPGYRIRRELGSSSSPPAIVVADTAGRIVMSDAGGRLSEVDHAIREQVRRLHPSVGFPADPEPSHAPPAASATPPRLVFLGTSRAAAGPLAGAIPGRTETYTTQFRFQEEGEAFTPYPVGRWTTGAEGLTAVRGGAANFVAIRHGGGQVSAVLGPPPSGTSRVWVLADEAWLAENARDQDVRADPRGATYIEVSEPRLYRIARAGKTHVLKLSPEAPGLVIYCFAFEPMR